MPDLDFRKKYKELYSPSAKKFAIVKVPTFQFLMIDGKGDPNTSKDYAAALEALYSVSFTLKFSLKFAAKKSKWPNYKVPPLEGLWWADDMQNFADLPKSSWIWTMMIAQPDFITKKMIKDTVAKAAEKKPNPALAKLRLEKYKEGRAHADHAYRAVQCRSSHHRPHARLDRRTRFETAR